MRQLGRAIGGSIAGVAFTLAMTGCDGGFFVDTTKTGTSSTTGSYVYVVNQTTDTLSEFVIGSSVLTAVSGSPVGLASGLVPASVAVTRPNTFVYVGGVGSIVCYAIGSGGALTAVAAGTVTSTATYASLDTSPDGKWLLALDSSSQSIFVYAINTSTGALTLTTTTAYAAPGQTTVVPRMIRIAPSGGVVMVALGTGGDQVFTFNTSTGALTNTGSIAISGYSDNAIAFDSASAYVYVARGLTIAGTSGIASYAVSTAGVLTVKQALATSGAAPYSLAIDKTGAYLYAANRGDATVSGYTAASGTLTALASSPYSSGTSVTALATESSGKYVIAAASGGSSDVTLYGFDAVTGGKLNALAVYASGTDPAGSVALATTH